MSVSTAREMKMKGLPFVHGGKKEANTQRSKKSNEGKMDT